MRVQFFFAWSLLCLLNSKAATGMCCWPLNLCGSHWHPTCIDLLHYLDFGRHFVSTSLLLLWLRFELRGTRGCWGSCDSLCGAVDESITRRVLLRRRTYV